MVEIRLPLIARVAAAKEQERADVVPSGREA